MQLLKFSKKICNGKWLRRKFHLRKYAMFHKHTQTHSRCDVVEMLKALNKTLKISVHNANNTSRNQYSHVSHLAVPHCIEPVLLCFKSNFVVFITDTQKQAQLRAKTNSLGDYHLLKNHHRLASWKYWFLKSKYIQFYVIIEILFYFSHFSTYQFLFEHINKRWRKFF